jgi:hypothetical protein
VLTALGQASDHLPIVADYFVPPNSPVEVAPVGESTFVMEAGRLDAIKVFLNTIPTSSVSVTVAGHAELDLGAGPGQPRTLTFSPANAAIPQTVVVAAVDDAIPEGTEEALLAVTVTSADPQFQNVALPDLRVVMVDNETPSIAINEIDSDTTGVDNREFVELFDGGFGARSLDGFTVVLYDGDTDLSYAAFDLDGYSTDSLGFFVLGNAGVANVDLVIPDNLIQNGADAVALYVADASDFPNGTPVTIANLVDAMVYGTDDPDDPQLLTLLLPGQLQPNENANGLRNTESVSRLPDAGRSRSSTGVVARPASPGVSNVVHTPAVTLVEPNGSTMVTEGGGSAVYTIALESYPTSVVTVLIDPDMQLDLGLGPGVARMLTFTPLNAVAPQTVTLHAVDDPMVEGPHGGVITHTVASGDVAYNGMTVSNLSITISDNDTPQLVINELDSDTPNTDVMEFVELWDGGVGNSPLDGLAVVFFNGSNDLQYAGFDLDGFSTDADGFFVLGNSLVPGVDLVFPTNLLQNGADAVALYRGNPASFPGVTTVDLVDAVVYDTADADDPGLLTLLLPGQPQVDEDAGGNRVVNSIARVPDGGLPRVTTTYVAQLPTPGMRNAAPPVNDGDFDDDGDYDCADVDALVGVVAAGTNFPAFDLDADGTVDRDDLNLWLIEAGAANLPGGRPYGLGDATLDGFVDQGDFAVWDSFKFTLQAAWCRGDFNADAAIDGADFNIWNANKQPAAAIRASNNSPDGWGSRLTSMDHQRFSRSKVIKQQLPKAMIVQRIGDQGNTLEVVVSTMGTRNGDDRRPGRQSRLAAVEAVFENEQFAGRNAEVLVNGLVCLRMGLAVFDVLGAHN